MNIRKGPVWLKCILRTVVLGFAALLIALAFASRATGAAPSDVALSLVSDSDPGPAAQHGLNKIVAALKTKNIATERAATPEAAQRRIVILTGLASGSGAAARAVQKLGIPVPKEPEALVIRHVTFNEGQNTLLVCGSDDRGLMYAELDVADRIGWATDPKNPLSEVRDAAEKPYVVDRALSIYTMHRRYFEDRLFNEDYWDRYFDVLAENRFNRFVLIFGYENGGYMAPPYPYFFDVEGFPDVRVVGMTEKQQKRYLDALNRMIDQAHARGLEFTIGIWDHIYRAGVQTGGVRGAEGKEPARGLVWGVTQDNLVPYSIAALKTLFEKVPRFDSIHFRMHGESGLRRSEMAEFWKNIYQAVLDARPEIRFDARAKNFPDSLIDLAVEMGVNIRITTKYWMEQMGMPFHPTHIPPQNQRDRRHGYADLLRYPKKYKMHWRLWNGGTSRILLWGDPDYARRFAESTHLYDGEGFEVNEPLATKMEAQPHDMEPFDLLNPKYRYYDYEFERYWHFFQVFGRLGYNPETPPEVWEKEFEQRFGKEAAPYLMRGLQEASRILPRIVAYCYPYNRFPTTRGWAEKQRMEDLPTFARALPSDTEQFLSPDEAARLYLAGEDSAKIGPWTSYGWFSTAALNIEGLVNRAEELIGEKRNREFEVTVVDLKILANLADYHSRRIRAAYFYALYKRSHDLGALMEAKMHEQFAVEHWGDLVDAAGDVYNGDLRMGLRRAGLAGHWRDELAALQQGLEKLDDEIKNYKRRDGDALPVIYHVPVRKPGWSPEGIRATVFGKAPIKEVQLVFRRPGGEYRRAYMLYQRGPLASMLKLPEFDEGTVEYYIEATDETGRKTTFPAEGADAPIVSKVIYQDLRRPLEIHGRTISAAPDMRPPRVEHQRVTSAPALKPMKIAASATDPSGVKWVRLRYRPVTQFEDYRTLEMKHVEGTDRYEAVVPGEHVVPKYDFMYFIEAVDNAGNGTIYPNLEKEAPYVIVKLER